MNIDECIQRERERQKESTMCRENVQQQNRTGRNNQFVLHLTQTGQTLSQLVLLG